MATFKKRSNYFESAEGMKIKGILELMENDSLYNTPATYSANVVQYPDNLIPFVDKHMNYLNTHPSLKPEHYLANLRLMTRVRLAHAHQA